MCTLLNTQIFLIIQQIHPWFRSQCDIASWTICIQIVPAKLYARCRRVRFLSSDFSTLDLHFFFPFIVLPPLMQESHLLQPAHLMQKTGRQTQRERDRERSNSRLRPRKFAASKSMHISWNVIAQENTVVFRQMSDPAALLYKQWTSKVPRFSGSGTNWVDQWSDYLKFVTAELFTF